MFKDIYKQANDKIDTDAPKSRVMAKLSKNPAPVVRKRYSAAKVAALAACFVLTIAAAGIYENMQKEMPHTLIEKTAEIAADTEKEANTPEAFQNDTVAKKTAEAPKVARTAKPSPKTVPQSSAKSEPAAAMGENSEGANKQETTAAVRQAPVEAAGETDVGVGASYFDEGAEEETQSEAVNSGVAIARFSLDSAQEKIALDEDYRQALGKNIPENVVLPDGVTNKTNPEQIMSAEEDKCTFLFAGDNKTIQIEATKTTDAVQAVIDNPVYEKRYIGESPAVVLKENGTLKAYLVSEGVGYIVTAENCTESETEELLKSLNSF